MGVFCAVVKENYPKNASMQFKHEMSMDKLNVYKSMLRTIFLIGPMCFGGIITLLIFYIFF